uniref:Amidase domain-containing protein n=2 Tax=Macrostomum lignano TaxID=282301 RepID=A0A1I8GA95_9PLAT
ADFKPVSMGRRQSLALALIASAAIAAAASGLASLLYDWRRRSVRAADLSLRRQRRRADLAEAKARFVESVKAATERAGLSPAEEAEILALPTAELVGRLQARTLDHRRVLLAYQRRAIDVDSRTNCAVEFLAPDWAGVDLDGPLAGLPVSLKDNFCLAGRDSCVGCSALIGRPAEADCSPVAALKALGGVPFVRTAVPQSMMSVLSSNPIDGTVRHPSAPGRSPGGSSSGEATLVAGGGSPLGLGTDLGGSIRLPAAWCGCVGFKPTNGRLTSQGFGAAAAGAQRLVPGTWGPLAPDVGGVALLMSAMCSARPGYQYRLDPELPPLDWAGDDCDGQRPLVIGYFVDESPHLFDALPCMRRAVQLAKSALESRGHRLVAWRLPDAPYFELYLRCVFSDGGRRLVDLLDGDEVSPAVRHSLDTARTPRWLRRARARAAAAYGRREAAVWLEASLGADADGGGVWHLAQRLADARRQFCFAWRQAGLDGLICPAGACPAVHLAPTSGSFTGALSFFNLFNTLNCPAGTVPVTRVTAEDLAEAAAAYPAGKSAWHRSVAAMHDAGSDGLPVSVQCAALPWRDEACLRLMAELEAAVARQ